MNSKLLALVLLLIAVGLFFISDVQYIILGGNQEPEALVLKDAQSKYPGARIELVESSKSGSDDVFRFYVLRKESSMCPERLQITYTYPKNRFVPDVVEITTGCKICKTEKCVIAFPEEAVIASHAYNDRVREFLSLNPDSRPYVSASANGFTVVWKSSGGQSIIAEVGSDASVTLVR